MITWVRRDDCVVRGGLARWSAESGQSSANIEHGRLSVESGMRAPSSHYVQNVDSRVKFVAMDDLLKEKYCDKTDVRVSRTVEKITWKNKYEFAFNAMGYSIGLGNIWRFSYLCFKNGGGAFLVPYVLMAALGSLPLLFMEVAVGQYTRRGCIAVWDIAPLFRGIGFSSMMMCLYYLVCFVLVLGWCIFYLINSFTMPWISCGNEWNTNNCIPIIPESSSENKTLESPLNYSTLDKSYLSTAEFWNNYVLQKTDGIEDLGGFSNWKIVGCFLMAWVLAYLCIARGIRTSGKVSYVTVLLPYVLMVALFFRGVTLDGAGTGILYFITPKLDRLSDPTVWLDAGSQVLFSIGVCYGVMFGFGSYNKRDFDCYKCSYVLVGACYGSSLFFGFVVFSFIGHMAWMQNTAIEDVVEGGPGLVFQVFPAELAHLPLPQLWSVVFFMTLVALALDSSYATAEACITALADYWPEKFGHKGAHIWRIGVCAFAMIAGLPQLLDGGIYIFELINLYGGSGICILWVAIFEGIVVAWIYGVDKIYNNVQFLIGYFPPVYFKYCLKYITTAFCFLIFIACCVSYSPLKLGDYVYPWWANLIGWIISFSVVSWIPIMALVFLLQTPGSVKKRVKLGLTSTKSSKEYENCHYDIEEKKDSSLLPTQETEKNC